jgi:hypothetical protein
MALRVLFTPFDSFSGNVPRRAPGSEYYEKNQGWVNSFMGVQAAKASVLDGGKAHDIFQVFYRAGMARSPMLAGLGVNDQIYIRGHSLAGFDGIFAHTEFDESGQRMHMSKMNRDLFNLLYAEAEPGARASRFSLTADQVADRLTEAGLVAGFKGQIKCYNCHSAEGNPNFATEMAAALTAKGVTSCGVLGYTGALSSMYDGAHKSSTDGGRASENRVVIRAQA